MRREVALRAVVTMDVGIEWAQQRTKRAAIRCVGFDYCNDGSGLYTEAGNV